VLPVAKPKTGLDFLLISSATHSAALSEHSVSQYPIVVAGAFFIASEQAKGGFDPHNH